MCFILKMLFYTSRYCQLMISIYKHMIFRSFILKYLYIYKKLQKEYRELLRTFLHILPIVTFYLSTMSKPETWHRYIEQMLICHQCYMHSLVYMCVYLCCSIQIYHLYRFVQPPTQSRYRTIPSLYSTPYLPSPPLVNSC